MPRIQGLIESGVLKADTQLSTVPGYVFSITIAWDNATAGEFVYLEDSSTGQALTAKEVPFCLPTASGTYSREWSNGKLFETGIFLDIGATTGQIQVELTYKT